MAQGLLDIVSQIGRGFEKIYDEQMPTMQEVRGLLGVSPAQSAASVPQLQTPPGGLLVPPPAQAAPVAAQAAPVADTGNVDWEFIGALEGSRINGYIPKNKKGKILGKSGVTIGTGVDLGSKNAAYFSKLDKSIRDKLSPYFGLKGTAAANKLKTKPLGLTKEEVIKINKITKDSELDKIKKRWKSSSKASNLPSNFDDLPKWMATPVVSALFQYGANSSPKLWTAITSGDVPAIEKVLRNFTKSNAAYQTRRDAEADYLTGTLNTSRSDLRTIIQRNAINPMLDTQDMDAF